MTVIVTEVAEITRYIFCKLVDIYAEWGLKININKTEHLSTSLNMDNVFEDTNLSSVEEFRYLKSVIHQGYNLLTSRAVYARSLTCYFLFFAINLKIKNM